MIADTNSMHHGYRESASQYAARKAARSAFKTHVVYPATGIAALAAFVLVTRQMFK